MFYQNKVKILNFFSKIRNILLHQNNGLLSAIVNKCVAI